MHVLNTEKYVKLFIPYALDENYRMCSSSKYHKDKLYFCPSCIIRLISKKGSIKQAHFAHYLRNEEYVAFLKKKRFSFASMINIPSRKYKFDINKSQYPLIEIDNNCIIDEQIRCKVLEKN